MASTTASRQQSPFQKSSSSVSPLKRKAMSITQTYYLAHTARGKLSSEAGRPDHNLRLLVGHANLLDSLMLELAEAEQEQESWFNQSVRRASKPEEPRHIQWADSVVEDPEEDWEAEDAESSSDDSDYDSDEDMEEMGFATLQRVPSRASVVSQSIKEVDEEEFEEDNEEDFADLQLQRTQSHSSSSPPELDHDSDSSEDESMPPSPPNNALPSFDFKSGKSASIPQPDQATFFDQGFFIPQRTQPGLISAISVY